MKKHVKVVHDTLIWKSFWRMQVIDHKTENGQMYLQMLFLSFFYYKSIFLKWCNANWVYRKYDVVVIKILLLMKIVNPFGYRV
jgi:hypothetical protein